MRLENDSEDYDYWKELEGIEMFQLMSNVNILVREDPKNEQLKSWIEKHQEGILHSYIKGLKEFRKDAFHISLHDFGLFLFVAMKYKGGIIKGEKPELKPKSIKLQKELDEMYSKDNVNKAIKDLGIITKEDLDKDNT